MISQTKVLHAQFNHQDVNCSNKMYSTAYPDREREKKVKQEKKLRRHALRYLIPIQKYFNPIKYIYYMDMVFPLNVINATAEDYHAGKLALVRNAQMRPKVVYDKKSQYVMVIMESPTMHVVENQCDYFLEYLKSLGNRTYKDVASVLENWKDLWTVKKLVNITGPCKLEPGEINLLLGANPDESMEEICDSRGEFKNSKPSNTVLKKLYFIDRTCRFKESNIFSNIFVIGYSKALLELLNVNIQDFLSGLGAYKIPISVKAEDNMTYRFNMISMMMYGNFPRLDTSIQFTKSSKSITCNPYLTCHRVYSEKKQCLNIRLSYSYKDQED